MRRCNQQSHSSASEIVVQPLNCLVDKESVKLIRMTDAWDMHSMESSVGEPKSACSAAR